MAVSTVSYHLPDIPSTPLPGYLRLGRTPSDRRWVSLVKAWHSVSRFAVPHVETGSGVTGNYARYHCISWDPLALHSGLFSKLKWILATPDHCV